MSPSNRPSLPPFQSSAAVQRIEGMSLRPSFAKVPGIISLAMGEPDFDTPREIVNAAVDAMRTVLGDVDIDGVVVIGEGEKDEPRCRASPVRSLALIRSW